MIIYFFPFVYGLKTRQKGLNYFVSYIVIFVLPNILISNINENPTVNVFFVSLLGLVALYSIYEVGYLFNDFNTTLFEPKPTYRLDKAIHDKLSQKFMILFFTRLLYTFMAISIILFFFKYQVFTFLVLLLLLIGAYAIHNSVRSNVNIFSIFIIFVLKYISVLLLISQGDNVVRDILFMVLLVPVIRTYEYSSKQWISLRIANNINFDKTRIYYYSLLLLMYMGLSMLYDFSYKYVFIVLVLLLFRVAVRVLLLIKKNGDRFKNE